jgi:ketosteroid isomerase-like protein
VVHPELGSARDPRTGLMTAWPELADQIDAAIEIEWIPETTVRAASGELAWSLGEYRAEFRKDGVTHAGKGAYVAVWEKDGQDRWQLAAEGFTPPGLHGSAAAAHSQN